MKCVWCDSRLEQIPYPRGNKYICPKCGEDFCDTEAMNYKLEQRKQLHKLMERISNTEEQ